jgi:hypothetical protein
MSVMRDLLPQLTDSPEGILRHGLLALLLTWEWFEETKVHEVYCISGRQTQRVRSVLQMQYEGCI